jgi:hypothetical protein
LGAQWQEASAAALELAELRAALNATAPHAVGSWEEVVLKNHLTSAVHNRAYAVLQVRAAPRPPCCAALARSPAACACACA